MYLVCLRKRDMLIVDWGCPFWMRNDDLPMTLSEEAPQNFPVFNGDIPEGGASQTSARTWMIHLIAGSGVGGSGPRSHAGEFHWGIILRDTACDSNDKTKVQGENERLVLKRTPLFPGYMVGNHVFCGVSYTGMFSRRLTSSS